MVLEKILPIIVIFIIGFLLKKFKILKKEDSGVLSKLILNLVVPAIIIDAIWSMSFESSLLFIPLSAIIIVASLLFIGYFSAQVFRLKGKIFASFIITFPTLEIGTIGYAFMLAAFGKLGLSRIVIFDAANIFFEFIVIYTLANILGKKSSDIFQSILSVFKTPLIWAIILGVLLNISGFRSDFLSNLFGMIGSGTIVLVMLLVALEFEPTKSSLKLPFLAMMLKAFSGLALGLLVSSFFGLSGLERIAVIVGASLPTSIITIIFAKDNRLDTRYAANLISISLPFSILFIFLLLGLL
jgi:hypothetical protein